MTWVLKALAAATGALLLGGCATQAARRFTNDKASLQIASAQLTACITPIAESRKYTPLAAHMSMMHPREDTLLQRSSRSFATPSEAILLSELRSAALPCVEDYEHALGQIDPRLSTVLLQAHDLAGKNDALLVERKITWGQFVSSRDEITTHAVQAMLSAEASVTADLQRENDEELRRRQQAWSNFANYMQREQMINAAERPVTTTCSGFGNYASCTSY